MDDGTVLAARLTEAVASLDVDVLAVQEVDRGQPRSGGTDQLAVAAAAAGAATGAFAGDVFTISELFTVGLPGNYTSGLACSGTAGLAGNVLLESVTTGLSTGPLRSSNRFATRALSCCVVKTWASA